MSWPEAAFWSVVVISGCSLGGWVMFLVFLDDAAFWSEKDTKKEVRR